MPRQIETPAEQVQRLRDRRAERLARKAQEAQEREQLSATEEATIIAQSQKRVFEIRVNQ